MTTFAQNTIFKTPSATTYRLASNAIDSDDDDDSMLGDVPVLSSVANELLAESSNGSKTATTTTTTRRTSITRGKSRTPGSNSKTGSSTGSGGLSNPGSISTSSPDFHTARHFVTPAARNTRRAYLSSVARGSGGSSGSGAGAEDASSAERENDPSRVGENVPASVLRTVGSVARIRTTTSSNVTGTATKRAPRTLGLGMPIRGPRREFSNSHMMGDGISPAEEVDISRQDFLAEAQIRKEEQDGMDIDSVAPAAEDQETEKEINSSMEKISMSNTHEEQQPRSQSRTNARRTTPSAAPAPSSGPGSAGVMSRLAELQRRSSQSQPQRVSPGSHNPLKRQSSASWREQAVPSKRESPMKKNTPPKSEEYGGQESPVAMYKSFQEQLAASRASRQEVAGNNSFRAISRSGSTSSRHSSQSKPAAPAFKFSMPVAPSADKENNDIPVPNTFRKPVSSFEMLKATYDNSRISPPASPIAQKPVVSKAPPPQMKQATPPRKALGPISVNTPHRQAPPPPPKMSAIEPASSQPAAASSTTRRKRQHVIVNGRQYLRLDQIGRGGSAKVYKVMAENYKMLAMKKVILEKQDEATIRGFKGEIDLLRKLQDVDRVVRLFDYEINDERSTLTVLLECGESDLNKVITSRHHADDTALDVSFIRHYWREMLECVAAVHGRNIVHSDLKPANFLLVQGRLKLIDFGIANAIQDDTVNVHREHQVGTVSYMAPETIVDYNAGRTTADGHAAPRLHKLGAPSDVWSLGCILYQMTYGRTPFAHLSTLYSKMAAIPDPKHEIEFASTGLGGSPVPASLIATMKGCLERDKDRRLTIKDMLSFEDPFLNPDRVTEGVADITEDVLTSLMENVADYTRDKGVPTEGQIRVWAKDVFGKLKRKMFERRGPVSTAPTTGMR